MERRTARNTATARTFAPSSEGRKRQIYKKKRLCSWWLAANVVGTNLRKFST